MTGLREPVTRTNCSTPWCQIHTPARCRSEPVEVVYRCGALEVALAVGLEQWRGGRAFGRREVTANLLLPDGVLVLPREPAVAFGRAWSGLLVAAGWVTPRADA